MPLQSTVSLSGIRNNQAKQLYFSTHKNYNRLSRLNITIGEYICKEASLKKGDKIDFLFDPDDMYCVIRFIDNDNSGAALTQTGRNIRLRAQFSISQGMLLPKKPVTIDIESLKIDGGEIVITLNENDFYIHNNK